MILLIHHTKERLGAMLAGLTALVGLYPGSSVLRYHDLGEAQRHVQQREVDHVITKDFDWSIALGSHKATFLVENITANGIMHIVEGLFRRKK